MIFWTKFAQKGISSINQKKLTPPLNSAYSNQCTYQISVETDNFDFLDQIYLKRVYLVKIGKNWTTYEFCIFEISRYQTSASRIKFASKAYSQSKKEKVNSTHHWILHIQISLGTKIQLKLTILIFWTKFAQNWYFQSESVKNEHHH